MFKPFENYDGVEVYNICDFFSDIDPDMDLSYEEENKAMKKWCKENDALYYGKPKVNFRIDEAVKQARDEGKTKVILEDLS